MNSWCNPYPIYHDHSKTNSTSGLGVTYCWLRIVMIFGVHLIIIIRLEKNNLPLLMVRLWRGGIRCISYYVLIGLTSVLSAVTGSLVMKKCRQLAVEGIHFISYSPTTRCESNLNITTHAGALHRFYRRWTIHCITRSGPTILWYHT